MYLPKLKETVPVYSILVSCVTWNIIDGNHAGFSVPLEEQDGFILKNRNIAQRFALDSENGLYQQYKYLPENAIRFLDNLYVKFSLCLKQEYIYPRKIRNILFKSCIYTPSTIWITPGRRTTNSVDEKRSEGKDFSTRDDSPAAMK